MCDYDEAQRFLDLVYIYKKDVYRIILSVVEDHYIADELAHIVMIKAWKGFSNLREPDKCKPWVKVITRNVIRDHMSEKAFFLSEFERELIVELDSLDELRLIEHDILDAVLKKENISNVFAALNSLDDKYRTVVKMNLISHIPLKEIAEMSGMNPGTVRMIYSRGMKMLRENYMKLEKGGCANG